MIQNIEITLEKKQRGFHLITKEVIERLPKLPESGLINVFCKHTSCGLTLNENCDPSVRVDLNQFYDHLIPEKSFDYTHTAEGSDDMPAHIKTAITGTHLSIPIVESKLALGTWQGIYLCEFRNHGGNRKLIISVLS